MLPHAAAAQGGDGALRGRLARALCRGWRAGRLARAARARGLCVAVARRAARARADACLPLVCAHAGALRALLAPAPLGRARDGGAGDGGGAVRGAARAGRERGARAPAPGHSTRVYRVVRESISSVAGARG
ncbi:MAG: hypothetical protein CL844_03590 [Crocinitomicaceae bacterium]|nr:hypothetical protein [Crocinitomicaceae bacterium]